MDALATSWDACERMLAAEATCKHSTSVDESLCIGVSYFIIFIKCKATTLQCSMLSKSRSTGTVNSRNDNLSAQPFKWAWIVLDTGRINKGKAAYCMSYFVFFANT